MKRFLLIAVTAILGACSFESAAKAQVFVRAPFVRVWVDGPNVQVRAPFVNLSTPSYYYYPGPVFVPAPRVVNQTPPPGELAPPPPMPKAPGNRDTEPPTVLEPAKAPTLSQFANQFQAKAGNYEVTLLNPVTSLPTPVRFSLPDGNLRRVHVRGNQIEFDYGPRRFVRIEFDRDGVQVVSR